MTVSSLVWPGYVYGLTLIQYVYCYCIYSFSGLAGYVNGQTLIQYVYCYLLFRVCQIMEIKYSKVPVD